MNTTNTSSPVNALFYKPELTVGDPESFEQVKVAIGARFGSAQVAGFLASLKAKKARIRDFEGVLRRGLLGQTMVELYSKLGNGDQGQIREFYLASLERVAPELRQKFFKLYSYY